MSWSIPKNVYKDKQSAINDITNNPNLSYIPATVKNLILEALSFMPEDRAVLIERADGHHPLQLKEYPIMSCNISIYPVEIQ